MNLILHLGLGSFHRAHQAVYLHHLMQQGETDWTIAGGNIRPDMAETIAALVRQEGEYTLETVTPRGERAYERIRSIRHIIPFEPDLAALIALGARAETRIISFTVTEAGYYLDSGHRLDDTYPELRDDLQGRTRSTIYGAIAALLRERLRQGGAPVTLLNCDNLRSNGDRFRGGLLDFVQRRGEERLREYIEAHTTCPNSMVDRITPRPHPDVAKRVQAATGWADGAPVMGEHFMQWVIEDHFQAGRPAWERVGAQLVDSVAPYEEAKIRILNASHSCIAWAGTLLGMTYIHEGVAHPRILDMARAYVTEDVIPCLDGGGHRSPVDLPAYRDVVLDRFSNPYLRDTNQRVAMDGFSKIPGFIAPTLRERLSQGRSIARTAMLPALFLAVLERWHRNELAYLYEDQGMDPAAAHAFFASPDPVPAFCRDAILWGPLAGDERLTGAVADAHREVQRFVRENVHAR